MILSDSSELDIIEILENLRKKTDANGPLADNIFYLQRPELDSKYKDVITGIEMDTFIDLTLSNKTASWY